MAIYLGTDKVSLGGTNGGFMLNGRLIATKEYEFKLSDTNYSSLTVSTTAQSLTLPATTYSNASTTITCFKLGVSNDGTIIDVYNHDYIVIIETVTSYVYSSSIADTIHGIKSVYVREWNEGKYYGSVDSATGQLNTAANPTYAGATATSTARLLYQKADNTYALSTTNYGVYGTPTPAAIGITNGEGYLDLKLSSFSVRANSTYFPEAAMNLLDTTNTKIKSTWYIYEGDKSMYGQVYGRACELVTS